MLQFWQPPPRYDASDQSFKANAKKVAGQNPPLPNPNVRPARGRRLIGLAYSPVVTEPGR